MNWHPIFATCPACKVKAKILAFRVNADANLLVEMVCPKCMRNFSQTYPFQVLKHYARNQDLKECIEKSELPYNTPEEKLADDAFLRELKIDPNPKLLKGDDDALRNGR